MIVPMPSLSPLPPAAAPRFLLRVFGLALALALAAPLAAQDFPKKELREKTTSSLGELRTLTEAKDYDGSLRLINRLLDEAPSDSFDTYVLSQIKAQVLLGQNQLDQAIYPLEVALRLGEGNPNFLDAAARVEQLNLLAQLYYQRATGQKALADQRASYETALSYIRRWFELAPRITAESRLFASSLHYQLATLGPQTEPDLTQIRLAQEQAQAGLRLSARPTTQLYLILVGTHLALREYGPAADLLELLAERDPKNSSTWSQLQSLYLTAAGEAKDPAEARRQNLRALLVLDRAQRNGALDTPRDRYTQIAILFNLQQYARAAALLEKGLAGGGLENTRRNWELLSQAYQQLDQELKALDALTRASALFPTDAALEFSLAQGLYNAGQVRPAYERAQSALGKGLDKPGPAQSYLAYLAYELQLYPEAQRWIDQARASGGVEDSQLAPLSKAITDALAQRGS
jgi:tetratricopeptide (TPR) repeat protein